MTAARDRRTESAAADDDFREFFRDHYSFVWRSARRLGALSAELDDIAQDVFLAVYHANASFEGRSSVKTWLFGITANTVKAWQRKEGRHHRRADAVSREPAPGVVDLADRYAASQELDRVLACLEDVQRATFILVELEDVAAQDVAEAFDVSVNTVHSRLRLARVRLQREVKRRRAQQRRQE